MNPTSYLSRLEADFDAMFRLPKIAAPDPIAEVETAEGMCGLPECDCSLRTRLVGDGCQFCNPEYAAMCAEDSDAHP